MKRNVSNAKSNSIKLNRCVVLENLQKKTVREKSDLCLFLHLFFKKSLESIMIKILLTKIDVQPDLFIKV